MKKADMEKAILVGLRKYESLHKTAEQRSRLRAAAGASDRMNLECVVRRMTKTQLGVFAVFLTEFLKELASPQVWFNDRLNKHTRYCMWMENSCLIVQRYTKGLPRGKFNVSKLRILQMGGVDLLKAWRESR